MAAVLQLNKPNKRQEFRDAMLSVVRVKSAVEMLAFRAIIT
jgi:hypothetical protein